MVKVLVVEDSAVVREFLVYVLSTDPEIQVVGTVDNGEEALDAVRKKNPNVVTMDIHMPRMNGFDATRRIMETHPTPIVIVSGSTSTDEVATTFHALESGALALVRRPTGVGHPEYEVTAKELIQTVKLMAEVKVVRRWPRSTRGQALPLTSMVEAKRVEGEVHAVAIGASTGGPLAVEVLLSTLSKDFPVPILLVQHMAAGFLQGFVEWLTHSSGLPVHVAAHGEHLLPGHVYVAPDGYQMGVEVGQRVLLVKDVAENGLRPSVSYLFRSTAKTYGRSVIGVLLTGMGKDGAEELKLMKDLGAITIAQDKESSIVHGMPGEAIRLGAASYVLSPENIGIALTTLTKRN